MSVLLHTFLDQAADLCPQALAATLDEASWSFAQSRDWAHAYAIALADMGISKGDRIIVQAEFSLAQLGLFFGAQRLGAVFAPLHPDFGQQEVLRAVRYLRPSLMVQDRLRATQSPRPKGWATSCLKRGLFPCTARRKPSSGIAIVPWPWTPKSPMPSF